MTARQAMAAVSLLAATLDARRGHRPIRLRLRVRRWRNRPAAQAKADVATWYGWGDSK